MDIVKENISLSELTHIENLSVRSSNVCEWNGLNDLIAILNYFWENNDFLSLRNCGQKSNTELIELCKRYEDFTLKPIKEKSENPIEKQVDSLTVRQRKILNNLIESQSSNLSVRSLNAIEKVSDSNLTIRGLSEILIDPKYDLGKIKNIGKKSVDELAIFFKEIREQIELVQLFENDDELTIELFNTYLRRKFCLNPNDIVQIWNNYNSQNGLPIFKTIDILTLNGHLFKEKEQDIFKRGFKFWTNTEPETLEDIGASIGLTRERTRQIRKKLLDGIDLNFAFLRGLEFDALNLYGIDVDSENIVIDENLIDEIQQKESVKYNSIFVTKILSLLFNKTHCIVGNIESCVFNSAKPKGIAYRWNSIYLISKEVDNIFDFESLAIDIDRRLSNRIDEDYSFHFETYLVSFLKEGFETDSYLITQIAEHIIFNEFEITVDLNDNITFKRNTVKQVFEYSREALEAIGEPSKVEVIYNKVKELYPDYNTDENSIRASMKRSVGFVPVGRASIFGLKKWNESNDSFKGGTMHDIAEEFLLQFDEPKYIDEITEYVSQFRPEATSKNLLYNLKSAENRRFRFFKNSHIGLMSKEYDTSFEFNNVRYGTRYTWDENYAKLYEFCVFNDRLPLASAIDEERKLYNFMNVQRNRIKKSKLSEDKVKKIEQLLLKYPVLRKRTEQNRIVIDKSEKGTSKERNYNISNRWWESYNKLLLYLEENNAYPTASKERSLYTFCYNCKRGLETETLNISQIEALEKMNFSFGTAKLNSWSENYDELKVFKAMNGWPKCIESDRHQIRLYRFCISLFKAYKNEALTKEQIEKLDDIQFPYQLGAFSNKWLESFEKLKKNQV